MFRVETLGRLTAVNAAGTSVSAPRRLAVLALAAAAGNRGISRDKLVAFLWPESPAEKARHGLEQLLYALRREAGAELFLSGNPLRLDPANVTSDVQEFERALAAGNVECAVPLHRGAFLDGFFLAGAPEFERWVDGERSRLAKRYADALEHLAKTAGARGDYALAVEWRRKLAELDPYDSRLARELMQALAASGNPGGALRLAQAHESLLRHELEATPDVSVTALADELRAMTTRADERSPSAPRQPADAEHPISQSSPSGAALLGAAAPFAPEDQTRGGVTVLKEAQLQRTQHTRRRRRTARFAAALAAAAVVALAVTAAMELGGAANEIQSLVILPLDNLTGDPQQEYFVEGMHDALIGELAQMSAVRVISRTSAMHYKQSGKSVPEIARELKVDAVVAGSVLRAGDRVRVTVRLIHAREDAHLWAQSYERNVRDILSLQSDIAYAVAAEIKGALSTAQREGTGSAVAREIARSPDPVAYDSYLKGRYHLARWPELAAEQASIRYYEAAIAKDSAFAPAYAGLAEVLLYTHGVTRRELERAKWAADRAVQLDPGLSEAYVALGVVRMREWDWHGAQEALTRAIALNPNSSIAHQWYAALFRQTMRWEEATREARRAAELDPLSLQVKTLSVGAILFSQHRYDEAIRVWDDVLEFDPNYGLAVYHKALAYALQGRGADAVSSAERAAQLLAGGRLEVATMWVRGLGYASSGQQDRAEAILHALQTKYASAPRVPGLIAALHLRLGRKNEALEWLERAYERRDPPLANITSEPWFDSLRTHPRFRVLRAKMGLP